MPSESATSLRRLSGLRIMEGALGIWAVGVLTFLYLPIAVLVAYSFNASRLNITWTGFTLHWYGEVWRNEPLIRALANSLIVAAAATAVSVALGTGGAWLMHRNRYRFSRAIQSLLCAPMVMPEIVMGISLLVFFTVVGMELGFTTVIVAHVTFCFPFVLVAVQARLRDLDPSLEEAALDLGASPLKAFLLVIVPSLRPAIIAGALMAFTLSMDELIVTYFTAGPESRTLPLQVFGMAKVGLNPMLNAVSAVLVAATAVAVLVFERVRRRI